MSDSLRLELKQSDGQVVLFAAGEIDVVTAPFFASVLAGICREPCDVTLDLAEVIFIDSSGLHVLLDTARTLAVSRFRVIIRRPSATVVRAVELAGLFERFTFLS